ncbi:VCBS repeat-containing protein [Eudoraea sp.]|uniref:VCBS repeat-containing protein n=4 Tax=Eudoraea sp. TaxID=1979955 RepID=UPI003C7269D9
MKFKTLLTAILFCMVFMSSCINKEEAPTPLFHVVPQEESGLSFNNQLSENDSINILDNEFVYNGSGVALGDLNGDGKDDIFLSANQVDNKLYLNEGNLKFKDVSETAQLVKGNELIWSSGVSIIDLNLDGKQDIYICNTFYKNPENRQNLLYINQGNNADNIPVFKEMAHSYGIADSTYSSHAQFFDYDNDGDLDLFIGVNRIEGINPSQFSPLEDDGSSMSRDRLYRNDWNNDLQHPVFTDVSEAAGIRYHGYSHSTLIHDFNKDGWMDIYVANDFLSNDLIYINNRDKTFTNRAGELFKHFSLSSMGSDIADVNNNGKMDIFTSEMQPYYNKRKKLFQGPSSYQKEIFTKKYNYESQYTRNTLQLNLGTNPETDLPIFGDAGMFAGVQETDWSWAPLFADFDNDGWQDLFITNGFPKDVTDRDFGDFRNTASRLVSKEKLIAAIPEIKIPNFMFRNSGDLNFEDVTDAWGLNFGTFSNGAAYGDLDQDGDLDLVVNNINDPVLLLENKANEQLPNQHYFRLKLNGRELNPAAFGSEVVIYSGGQQQRKSILSGRGYLSKPESTLHFGMGTATAIDSVKIIWPGRQVQKLGQQSVNKLLVVNYNAPDLEINTKKVDPPLAILKEVSAELNLDYLINDDDFIDFNFQRTLPHKFSQYGPSISVGDVNGDDLDDMFVGSTRGFKEKWFLQTPEGGFNQKEVVYKNGDEMEEEDANTLLFDVDGDSDLDLYIARGSAQYPIGSPFYQDILLLNDGKGNYTQAENALPNMRNNSSSLAAADFDQDGDLDLFVGSRVLPMAYPSPDRSYILRNDSDLTQAKFVDITKEVAEELEYAGLISDALWTDFNGDSWPDLILAGEWMSLQFYENKEGKLINITESSGISEYSGWWNSLSSADLDNDGDMDYIAGNFGENINFKAKKDTPVRLYAKDLDDNGMIDPFISYYLRDSTGVKKEYLYHPWQDMVKQYVGIRKRFNSFGAFGEATLPEIFEEGMLDDAVILEFNYMKSSWIENLGNGEFQLHAFPLEAQIAPVYGILTTDVDQDKLMDIIMVGNDFGMEVQQGPADAFVGLILHNKGNGVFEPIPLENSHFYVPGDAKSLVKLNYNNQPLIIATQNNDYLKAFNLNVVKPIEWITLLPQEVKAKVFFTNDEVQLQEFYWGSSFQSQSTRQIEISPEIKQVEFYDHQGKVSRRFEF